MTTAEETVVVQKQGEIIAVLPQKSGFTEIQIQEEGKQYPYKASTKIPEIIEAAQAGLFQQAVLTAKEADSGNPNPHRPGFNYINRTAMKVEVGGTVDAAAAPAPSRNVGAPAPGPPPLTEAVKNTMIVREACLKVAATLVAATGTSDGDVGSETISLAARFETWVKRDVDDVPFE